MFFTLQISSLDGTDSFRPVFVALTQTDILIYDQVPAVKPDWAQARASRPSIATRLGLCGEVDTINLFELLARI